MLRMLMPCSPPSLQSRKLVLLAMLCTVAATACETKSLHPSFGLRYKEMQAAQVGARGAHEPIMRGEDAARAVQLFYGSKLNAGPTGGGGGAPAPMMNTTAGVPPLH